MRVMIFDTETTGIPNWKEPSENPDQPHVVQYAAAILDGDTGQITERVDMIVRPDGWIIPDEVAAIHGITTERALDEGVPERHIIEHFLPMWGMAGRISAFNIDFDLRILRICLLRTGTPKDESDRIAEAIKPIKHDLMRQAAPICKIPPTNKMMATGLRTFKNPTLSEAIEALFGETLADAHNAVADLDATIRIYLRLNPPPGSYLGGVTA